MKCVTAQGISLRDLAVHVNTRLHDVDLFAEGDLPSRTFR